MTKLFPVQQVELFYPALANDNDGRIAYYFFDVTDNKIPCFLMRNIDLLLVLIQYTSRLRAFRVNLTDVSLKYSIEHLNAKY